MTSSAAIYSLKCQGRTVTAQESVRDRHRFVVGTCSAKEDNEIHIIEFDEDQNEIHCVRVLAHNDEVWRIAAHPTDPTLLATVHHDRHRYRATLWKTHDDPNADADASNGAPSPEPLTAVLSLPINDADTDDGTEIHSVILNTAEGDRSLLSLDSAGVKLWSLSEGGDSVSRQSLSGSSAKLESMTDMTAACFDPHHPSMFVTTANQSIYGVDLRSSAITHTISDASEDLLLDIDYNPNKPYHILSAGCDRIVRLWDLRKPSASLRQLGAHTHWVWQCRYNRFHDQLIVSAGSELVNLWSIVSQSSAPLGELEANSSNEKNADKLVKTYQDHEDSVYAAAWSAYDAWVFATASYDGRIVINQVPPAEKYKILL